MNKINYKNIHNRFKLNGLHYDKNQLKQIAYSFIKEGDVYQKNIGDFLLDWFDENEFIDLQTSGTTGTPKIISLQKQAMVNSALSTGNFLGLEPSNKALHCLPTNFIAGKMMFVRAFILGLDIDFIEPNSHPLKNNKTRYDFVAMVPLQVQNSLDNLQNIKNLIVGGTKINQNLEKSLLNLKNTSIYETYGMTETVTHIAARRVGEESFCVLPNINISTDDRNCLVIDAPNVSKQKIITNDIVEIIDNNKFNLLGRFDNLINSGGIKLFPELIEAKLEHKINNRFFVIGLPDNDLGEKLVLFIESEETKFDNDIFDELSKFEKPKEIIFIKKFKETETGKILRKETLESVS